MVNLFDPFWGANTDGKKTPNLQKMVLRNLTWDDGSNDGPMNVPSGLCIEYRLRSCGAHWETWRSEGDGGEQKKFQSGWWFQTWLLFSNKIHFIYGMSSFPVTLTPSFFKMVIGYCTTKQQSSALRCAAWSLATSKTNHDESRPPAHCTPPKMLHENGSHEGCGLVLDGLRSLWHSNRLAKGMRYLCIHMYS